MTRRRHTPAAWLRGMAAGLLTAALALAAHAVGSGVAPSGSAAALLGVLAATVGAVAATHDRASDTRILLILLAIGQLIGHATLAVADHGDHHGGGGPPAATMLGAHVAAVGIGALLINAGERLCRAVCTAMRGFAPRPPRVLAAAAATPAVGGDQPLRAALLLAASMSHRGPPVAHAR